MNVCRHAISVSLPGAAAVIVGDMYLLNGNLSFLLLHLSHLLLHSDRSRLWSRHWDGEVFQHQMSCFWAAAKCGGAGCNRPSVKDAWWWPKCKLIQQ